MQVKVELLTARSIAGKLYAGKLHATYVFQRLEELGYDDKVEEIHELLSQMYDAELAYANNSR